MNLDELKAMTFSEIEHSGVKGMKWGKRKGVTTAKAPKEPGKIKKSIASSKREALLLKDLRNTSKMTDDQLKTKTKRIQSENDLKRLTETKGITKGTKKAYAKREIYWDRDKMSDTELKTKIDRLQLEANLKKQIKKSNATHIKATNSLINSVSKLTVSQFSDEKGNFSATGDPIYDSIISSVLKQTSKQKMIQQSAIDFKDSLNSMTVSELEHAGVKGMKWGVRKAHDTSTKSSSSSSSTNSSSSSNSDNEYTKALSSITNKKLTPAQREENLKRNKEKSLSKLGINEKKHYPLRLKRHY